MAIFEKTIRNKNFDKLLRKLENEIPDSAVFLVVRHNKMISSLCRGAVIYITFLN